MTIIPLSEGAFSIDKTKVFVPFNKGADDLQQRAVGSLLVEIQPFVVITDHDIILLDTGLGFTDDKGIMQIHKNLAEHDINSTDITKVFLSHLHKDHSGGVAMHNQVTQQSSLSFSNATYYVNKDEFDYAIEQGHPSYIPEDFDILRSAGNVEFLQGDGMIDGYIRYETTGAHCPYHMVCWIEENKECIFFGADVAPQLQQMKSRFIAKYDYDGKKCMELRTQWWQQAKENHWTMLFYHDIKTPSIVL